MTFSKKGTLIAAACAAAFAAPQAAFAGFEGLKTSGHALTLQGAIASGIARHETSGSAGGNPVDGNAKWSVYAGESNVRISSSSKLSGGFLTGYGFQMESGFEASDGTVSTSQGTLASRNTALGVGTVAGTLFFGRWDTPYKLSNSNHILTSSAMGLGASNTGFLGNIGIGTGSFSGGTSPALNSNPSATGETSTSTTMSFRRRQGNTINFISNGFGGFQFALQIAPSEETGNNASVTAVNGAKPNLWSAAVDYTNGPLNINVAYEKHNDYMWGSAVGTKLGPAAGSGTSSSDNAILVGAGYRFGPVRVELIWERLDYGQSASTSAGAPVPLTGLKTNKFYTGFNWNIQGPHTLIAAFGRAGDLKCEGTAAFLAAAACNDTGAKLYNIVYRYRLAGSTYLNLGYHVIDNDRNGNYRNTNQQTGGTAATQNGHTDKGWAAGFNTSF